MTDQPSCTHSLRHPSSFDFILWANWGYLNVEWSRFGAVPPPLYSPFMLCQTLCDPLLVEQIKKRETNTSRFKTWVIISKVLCQNSRRQYPFLIRVRLERLKEWIYGPHRDTVTQQQCIVLLKTKIYNDSA